MNNKKVHLSLPDKDIAKFDTLRKELGMNRSQYVCYLLSGERKKIPNSIKQKNLISKLSNIDLHLRHICLKEGLSEGDVLYVHEAVKELRQILRPSSEGNDNKSYGDNNHEKI